jgi:hypothetical protein
MEGLAKEFRMATAEPKRMSRRMLGVLWVWREWRMERVL